MCKLLNMVISPHGRLLYCNMNIIWKNVQLTPRIAVQQMRIANAHHIVAAKVHVHLAATVVNPPEPEYGHFGVDDAHFRGADITVDPLVV